MFETNSKICSNIFYLWANLRPILQSTHCFLFLDKSWDYTRRTYFSPPKYKTLLLLFWTDVDIIGPKITWHDWKMNYRENRTEPLKHRPKNCLKLIILSKHLPLYFSRLNKGSPRKSWPCLPFQWCLCRSFFPGSSVVTQLDLGQWTSSSRLCLQG